MNTSFAKSKIKSAFGIYNSGGGGFSVGGKEKGEKGFQPKKQACLSSSTSLVKVLMEPTTG